MPWGSATLPEFNRGSECQVGRQQHQAKKRRKWINIPHLDNLMAYDLEPLYRKPRQGKIRRNNLEFAHTNPAYLLFAINQDIESKKNASPNMVTSQRPQWRISINNTWSHSTTPSIYNLSGEAQGLQRPCGRGWICNRTHGWRVKKTMSLHRWGHSAQASGCSKLRLAFKLRTLFLMSQIPNQNMIYVFPNVGLHVVTNIFPV